MGNILKKKLKFINISLGCFWDLYFGVRIIVFGSYFIEGKTLMVWLWIGDFWNRVMDWK